MEATEDPCTDGVNGVIGAVPKVFLGLRVTHRCALGFIEGGSLVDSEAWDGALLGSGSGVFLAHNGHWGLICACWTGRLLCDEAECFPPLCLWDSPV